MPDDDFDLADDDFDLADAYAVETPEDNRQLYAKWAATYESGFMAERGYVYHENVAALLLDLDPSAPVVDIGCGTGVVGEVLASAGVTVIDGVDISPEMLAASDAKRREDGTPVYRHLIEADLTATVPIDDGTYASVISVGAFTYGHLGPSAIDELLRIASPGAAFALGINEHHFAQQGYAQWFAAAEQSGKLVDLRFEDRPIYAAEGDEHAETMARVALFRRAG